MGLRGTQWGYEERAKESIAIKPEKGKEGPCLVREKGRESLKSQFPVSPSVTLTPL